MAPTLNRFCIVNLQAPDFNHEVDEFLQDPYDLEKDLVNFTRSPIGDEIREVTRGAVKSMLNRVYQNFSEGAAADDGSQIILDINNQDLADIYDSREGPIYNFISGRTMSYLNKITLAFYETGVFRKRYTNYIDNMVLGLVGRGTNNFKNAKQEKDFADSIKKLYHKVLNDVLLGAEKAPKQIILDFSKGSISDSINEWETYHESEGANMFDQNFVDLYNKIYAEYKPDTETMKKKLDSFKDKNAMNAFLNDMTRLDRLVAVLDKVSSPGGNIRIFIKNLHNMQDGWKTYKDQAKAKILSNAKSNAQGKSAP